MSVFVLLFSLRDLLQSRVGQKKIIVGILTFISRINFSLS